MKTSTRKFKGFPEPSRLQQAQVAENVFTVVKEWCLDPGEKVTLPLDDAVMDGLLCIHGIISEVTGDGGITQTWIWAPFPWNGIEWEQTAAHGILSWGNGLSRWKVDGEAVLVLENTSEKRACLELTIAGTEEECPEEE